MQLVHDEMAVVIKIIAQLLYDNNLLINNYIFLCPAWLFKIMHCNRFIGETLVRTYWLSDESVVLAASAMYQEQVPSCKHLDEPLDEGRFVLNVFW